VTTIRVRLTLIYSGLFLLTSIVLLVTVNLLLRQTLDARIARLSGGAVAPTRRMPGDRLPPLPRLPELVNEVIGYQWQTTVLTVGILALVSLVVGWLVAGRILWPIHRITATAQRLSLSTLPERIALAGPKDELKELADTFDAMLDRLERSVEGQRRFIANASHELRTPLAVQRAAIEIGLPEDVGEIRGTSCSTTTARRTSSTPCWSWPRRNTAWTTGVRWRWTRWYGSFWRKEVRRASP
jgi:signal transduction histidine kinase